MSKPGRQLPVAEVADDGRNGNAPTAPVGDGAQKRLEQLYTFRDGAEVRRFLAAHAFLVPFLEEAYPPIRKHFPQAALFLELVTDPEVSDFVELVVAINPTCPP